MDNGSTTEGLSGQDAADLAAAPAASLTLATAGYCAGCGTWDTHSIACSSCGYDFSGTQTNDPRA